MKVLIGCEVSGRYVGFSHLASGVYFGKGFVVGK